MAPSFAEMPAILAEEKTQGLQLLFKTGTKLLDTAKVFVCGDNGIGKTSLIKTLDTGRHLDAHEQPPDEPDKPDERTAGIRLSQLSLSHTHENGEGEGQDATLRVFDFGGQPEFHVMHTLLVSDWTAAFVVCVDLSKSHEKLKQRLWYWLRFIATRVKQSKEMLFASEVKDYDAIDKRPRVILVGTKADKCHTSHTLTTEDGSCTRLAACVHSIVSAFSAMLNIMTSERLVALNCFRSRDPGFETLKLQLKQHWQQIRNQKIVIPAVVPEVLAALSRLAQPHYTMALSDFQQHLQNTYSDLRPASSFSSDRKHSTSHQAPHLARAHIVLNTLRYFHLRGDMLFFESIPSLATTVFVDPNWLLNAVLGRALAPQTDQPGGFRTQNGEASWHDIAECFRDLDIDTHKVVDVLTSLRLCFELPERNGQRWFLLPSRLTEDIDPQREWQPHDRWAGYCGRRLAVLAEALVFPAGSFAAVQAELYRRFGSTLKLWRDAFIASVDGAQCVGLLRSDRVVDLWVRWMDGAMISAWEMMTEVHPPVWWQLLIFF